MKQLTKEQVRTLAQCADAKALLAALKELGATCSEEDAKKLFDKLHTAELSDEELDNVAGGLRFLFFGDPSEHNIMTAKNPSEYDEMMLR